MTAAAAALSIVLAAWLVGVQPWLGRARYARLKAGMSTRLHHYRRGVAGEWIMAGIVAVIALLAHGRLRSLWPPGHSHRMGGEVVSLVLVGAAVTAGYRVGGKRAGGLLATQLRPVAFLIPRTSEERRWFAALSVTAGVCEELIFRGFGLAALRWVAPGASDPVLIAATAGVFGLAHLYQGPIGVVLTGAAGAVLAWIVVGTGSLLPAMLLHALMDLRILALPLDEVTATG